MDTAFKFVQAWLWKCKRCPEPLLVSASSSWLECSGSNNVSLNIRIYHVTNCGHKSFVNMSDLVLPVWDMIPEDMSPETEWGRMCGLSGDVTLWVLFGGRPGLELKSKEHRASSNSIAYTEYECDLKLLCCRDKRDQVYQRAEHVNTVPHTHIFTHTHRLSLLFGSG